MARAKTKAKTKSKPQTKPKPKSAKPAKAAKVKTGAKAKKSAKSAKPVKSSKAAQATKSSSKSSSRAKSSGFDLNSFITPLDDRLIVAIETLTKTAGGLFIPATMDSEKPTRGKVLAVGRGHLDKKGRVKPMDVQAGDEVLFTGYSGTSIKLGEHDVLFLREADLLGVVG